MPEYNEPQELSVADQDMLERIYHEAAHSRLAVFSCTRKADNAQVALLVAIDIHPATGEFLVAPRAELLPDGATDLYYTGMGGPAVA